MPATDSFAWFPISKNPRDFFTFQRRWKGRKLLLRLGKYLQRLLKAIFKASGADQARYLLDILPFRGPKAFDHFVESLREDYDWLADDLEEAGVLGSNRTSCKVFLSQQFV